MHIFVCVPSLSDTKQVLLSLTDLLFILATTLKRGSFGLIEGHKMLRSKECVCCAAAQSVAWVICCSDGKGCVSSEGSAQLFSQSLMIYSKYQRRVGFDWIPFLYIHVLSWELYLLMIIYCCIETFCIQKIFRKLFELDSVSQWVLGER